MAETDGELKRTGLYQLHLELGARMVPFAGWEMPVQYPIGVMGEHLHTRGAAGLFDVSHMGQVILSPRPGRTVEDVALALEALMPVDLVSLAEGRQRYGFFTKETGGILDDLMVARRDDHLFLVVNAARAEEDLALMVKALSASVDVVPVPDRALLALQGPKAEAALAQIVPEAAALRFMDAVVLPHAGGEVWVSRSGYTGEDGFEISLPADEAEGFARALLAMDEVAPVGLGARDSLRLEAGLCLYGSDIDATTSPVEADLSWAMQRARRPGGARAGGYPGAARIERDLDRGPPRLRVGLAPDGRAPMRAGTAIFDGDELVGTVTSGAFGPTLGAPMSMGYVTADRAAPGTELTGEVRGKKLPLRVVDLPFVPARFKR